MPTGTSGEARYAEQVTSPSEAPEITVVVVTYDQAWCLEEAVLSVLDQGGLAKCIIVVDACPAGTDVVAHRLALEHPDQVRVVVQPFNQGQSAARNCGLRQVDTPWTLFLDGDDRLVGGGSLRALLERVAIERIDPGIIFGRMRLIDDAGEPVVGKRWIDEIFEHVVLRHGRAVASPLCAESVVARFRGGVPGSWLLSTDTMRKVGGFDERLRAWEDVELLARLLPDTTALEVETPVLEYRVHGSQQSKNPVLVHRTRLIFMWAVLRRAQPKDRHAVGRGVRSIPFFGWRRSLQARSGIVGAVEATTLWAAIGMVSILFSGLERIERAVNGPAELGTERRMGRGSRRRRLVGRTHGR